jgi:hypothetical protein
MTWLVLVGVIVGSALAGARWGRWGLVATLAAGLVLLGIRAVIVGFPDADGEGSGARVLDVYLAIAAVPVAVAALAMGIQRLIMLRRRSAGRLRR